MSLKPALEFVIEKVRNVHPKTLHGFPPDFEVAAGRARAALEKPLTATQFYFVVSEMLAVLKDAHTAIEVRDNALPHFQFIPLPFQWLVEGLVVTADLGELRRGDRINVLGGTQSAKLLPALKKIISAENEYFIRGIAPDKLIRSDFLEHFGMLGADGTVRVVLERGGQSRMVNLALRPWEETKPGRNWVGYSIDAAHSLGVFHVDRCECNPEYVATLAEFMLKVAQQKISTIAVDLRRNRGGDGLTADLFLLYIDPFYVSYASQVRKSQEVVEQIPIFASEALRSLAKSFGVDMDRETFLLPKELVKAGLRAQLGLQEVDSSVRFRGALYILTSNLTFSSANLFATLVQANRLGKILGEPTGNEINLCGNMLNFDIPETDFMLTLASDTKRFQNTGWLDLSAVMPDFSVPTTRRDIREGKDTQVEWLKQRKPGAAEKG